MVLAPLRRLVTALALASSARSLGRRVLGVDDWTAGAGRAWLCCRVTHAGTAAAPPLAGAARQLCTPHRVVALVSGDADGTPHSGGQHGGGRNGGAADRAPRVRMAALCDRAAPGDRSLHRYHDAVALPPAARVVSWLLPAPGDAGAGPARFRQPPTPAGHSLLRARRLRHVAAARLCGLALHQVAIAVLPPALPPARLPRHLAHAVLCGRAARAGSTVHFGVHRAAVR
mmetsp:Transcript_8302/g.25994  ORF Transcript_8302/g.25994 Transcript_8302/m.25994 type:complete len:229 (+) Transcript_8302:860-1546(+)